MGAPRFSQTRRPLLVGIGALAAILALGGYMSLDARRQAGALARRLTESLVNVLERDIARNIEVLDLSLQAVVEGVSRPDVMSSDPELRKLILFDRSAGASGLGLLAVSDRHGRILLESRHDNPPPIEPVLDRDYFQAQVEHDQGLYISRSYRSRLMNKTVIGLSRRISNPDGSFGGIALATIEIRQLTELIGRLHLGEDAVVSLVRDDGLAILRQTAERIEMNVDLSAVPVFTTSRNRISGFYVGRSPYDKIERVFSFQQVGGYPLKLAVGIGTKGVYADWKSKTALLAGLLLTASAIVLGLIVRLLGELKARARIEDELSLTNRQLEALSLTDALTGIGNRRYFDDALSREIRRCRRTGRRFALMLIDIDEFKAFNDRYGHAEGDTTLKLVARAICDSLRQPGDMAFRVGGEEFAILLSESNDRSSVDVARLILESVRALKRQHLSSVLGHLTVSIGLAEFAGEAGPQLYERADRALYEAKHEGRDRLVIDDPRSFTWRSRPSSAGIQNAA